MTKYTTNSIPYASAINALHARRFAMEIGLPLNVMVSINWSLLGVTEYGSTALFKELKTRVRRAWRHRFLTGQETAGFAYVEVQENPDGKNHTHWVFHANEINIEWYQSIIEQRLEKLCGISLPKKVVKFTRIETGGSLFKYLFKGISPAYSKMLYIDAKDQGTVYGQRTGVSRNISITARKRAKWVRKNCS